ncbi:MAG: FMN-binding negative transcriptional regulator [Acidimicrobiales bacterium]
MLIHGWDEALDEGEWRSFVETHAFGHLVASGRDRDVPVVVPTQFVLIGDEVLLRLARPNPVWSALEENPNVLLSIAGDWAYIPSSWKAIGEEDPQRGIPTTYYAAVQLVGVAHVIDDVDAVAAVLREQLADVQANEPAVDPTEHGSRLRAIRSLRMDVGEVRAKFKYGGNVDTAHREAVREHLHQRQAPGDAAALVHLERRLPDPSL